MSVRLVKLAVAVAVLAAAGAVVAAVWIGASVREDTVLEHPYEEGLLHGGPRGAARECDLGAGPCTGPLPGGGEVTLELSPRPLVTMRELAVAAQLRGPASDGAAVTVAFAMPGMDMGRNEARLAPAGGGRHLGKAVLVRCPSGKKAWTAELRVERAGAPARTARFRLAVEE